MKRYQPGREPYGFTRYAALGRAKMWVNHDATPSPAHQGQEWEEQGFC
jgi:hypothetical protein